MLKKKQTNKNLYLWILILSSWILLLYTFWLTLGAKGVGRNHLGNDSSPKPASNAFI